MPLHSEFSFWKKNPHSFEDPSAEGLSEQASIEIEARNLLKHFIDGTSIFDDQNSQQFFPTSLLLHKGFKRSIYNRLFSKRDPKLLKALRGEMQRLILNNFATLNHCSPKAKERYEHFQSTFLALYGFLEPEVGETIQWTQAIQNNKKKGSLQFELIDYRFGKIDISPKSGLLSWILEAEDKIYAYTLTPTHPLTHSKAYAHLIFMGTTYPVAQGGRLSQLYNVYPKHSIGEAHDMNRIDLWLSSQADKSVKVCGHSKGGTMAQIAAAKWPHKIQQANCLAPTALASDTLNRFKSSWNALSNQQKPEIRVFSTCGDPVYKLDKGFLPQTRIFLIQNKAQPALNHRLLPHWWAKACECHIAYNMLRNNVVINELTPSEVLKEQDSKLRIFLHDVKYTFNFVSFVFNYASLCLTIMNRKLERRAQHYSPLLNRVLTAFTFLIATLKTLISHTIQVCTFIISCLAAGLKLGFLSCIPGSERHPSFIQRLPFRPFAPKIPICQTPHTNDTSICPCSPLRRVRPRLGLSL